MARRNPRPRDTRDRLLAAALEVFGEKGYAASSVDEIVDRAGSTRGSFYYYFADKEDAARDLQEKLWQRLAEEAQEAFDPSEDTITNLKRAFGAHLSALSDLGQARFFLREGWLVPELESAGRSHQARATALAHDLLEEGMACGDVRRVDPTALAVVLTGLFEEATLHVLSSGQSESTVEVVHVLLDGLRPSGSVHAEARPQGAGNTAAQGRRRASTRLNVVATDRQAAPGGDR